MIYVLLEDVSELGDPLYCAAKFCWFVGGFEISGTFSDGC